MEKINGPLTPLPFTVTVKTDYDVAGMLVFVQASDVRVIFEPADVWTVDAIANEPVVITSTVTFPQEGSVMFTALAQDSQRGLTVEDAVRVRVTSEGGVIAPADEPQGTQIAPDPSETPPTPSSSPSPEAQPLHLSPQDLASRCGWDAEAVKSWEGATLQINRPLEAANAEWLKVEYEVLIDDPQDIGALHTVEFVFCFEEEDDSALEGDRWRGPIDVRAGDPMRAAEILL